jgi:hypothetical protein
MVFDVNSRHMDQIPGLESSSNALVESDCGIHTIEINPSRSDSAFTLGSILRVNIFGDFRQFSAKQLAFFLENLGSDPLLA